MGLIQVQHESMKLYQEILREVLATEKIEVTFPNLKITAKEIVEMKCYQALEEIKGILENDGLEDKECFEKIEEIICIYERLGSDGGNRHDF